MKIYIATSWKLENIAKMLAAKLREEDHEVDCFCDPSTGRYVFHWTEFVSDPGELKQYDAKSFINDPKVQRAFKEDKKHIDWADAVVMILPCGRSAHLEAGYAKGCGKRFFIWGELVKGEFDVMYGFADGIYRMEEAKDLIMHLRLSDLQIKKN